jgi:hypothetical protein
MVADRWIDRLERAQDPRWLEGKEKEKKKENNIEQTLDETKT